MPRYVGSSAISNWRFSSSARSPRSIQSDFDESRPFHFFRVVFFVSSLVLCAVYLPIIFDFKLHFKCVAFVLFASLSLPFALCHSVHQMRRCYPQIKRWSNSSGYTKNCCTPKRSREKRWRQRRRQAKNTRNDSIATAAHRAAHPTHSHHSVLVGAGRQCHWAFVSIVLALSLHLHLSCAHISSTCELIVGLSLPCSQWLADRLAQLRAKLLHRAKRLTPTNRSSNLNATD